MAAAAVALRRVADEHGHVTSHDEDGGKNEGAEAHPPSHPHIPIRSWDCARVEAWLSRRGDVPKAVVAAVKAAELDGWEILELGAKGWEELGLSSRVAQAKLVAAIKRYGTEDVQASNSSGTAESSKGKYTKAGKRATVKLIYKRTPEGGAEHTDDWLPAIVNANADPSNTKQHILRFLGMYNVVDLLAFTISISFLLSAEPAVTWYALFLHSLLVVSSFQTGIGLLASTVLYNTTSCVSDANIPLFAKQTATIAQIKLVNDYSIFGFLGMIIACAWTAISLGVGEALPLAVDTSEPDFQKASVEYLAFFVARLVFVFAAPFGFFFYRSWGHRSSFLVNISMTTHAAMFGGLMGDVEVLPPGEEPGWAIRASLAECDEFCCGQITLRMEDPVRFREALHEHYSSQASAEARPVPHAEVSPLTPLLGDAVAALLAAGKGGKKAPVVTKMALG